MSTSPTSITLCRPDDMHLHVRDGEALRAVLPFTAARFARALIMPNLKPPVTSTRRALDYRRRILEAVPDGARFEPLMTLYLTDGTDPAEADRAKASGCILGFKLYPAGATTHSDAGVTDIRRVDAVLARMEEIGLVLEVHGEVSDPAVDIFEREARFIDTVLSPLTQRFPRLRIVFEHITTRAAVDFVLSGGDRLAATVTPQHVLMNRNALFAGGLRPHHYCLPVLKREADRQALLEALASGNPRFFLGTDSAPHGQAAKEAACGCAGVFSAHAGLELYAEVFEAIGRIGRLEAFAAQHGADFYGLPRNSERIHLIKRPWVVPASYSYGADRLVPLRSGERIGWQVASDPHEAIGADTVHP